VVVLKFETNRIIIVILTITKQRIDSAAFTLISWSFPTNSKYPECITTTWLDGFNELHCISLNGQS